MDSLKVSLLKCTTASETLVMHRTTFLCLSLVPVKRPRQKRVRTVRLMHQDRDYTDGAKSMPH